MARSDEQLYNLIIASDCYKTISEMDKSKVARARNGIVTRQCSSRIGIVAWELGLRAHAQEAPPPPPPPPPPKPVIAPRTFNPEGGSDARYCITGLPRDPNRGDLPYDQYTHYDVDGLDKDGGRDPAYISRRENGVPLRGARQMDHYGPCDLYDGLTEWPPDSYHR